MDVIGCARELGKAIQADECYKEYMAAKEQNDADTELQNLIGEFNLIRQNYSLESSKPEEEQDKDKLEELNGKMRSAYNAVMTNENMANFTMAKAGMDKIMNQINVILTHAMQGDDPATCPTEISQSSCSGSCESCGGCG